MAPQAAAPSAPPAAACGTAWAYRLLGLSREEATRKTTKEAYNRVLKTAHPDKGGDTAQFLQARRALQAVQSDLERDSHTEWDWRQGRSKQQAEAAATVEKEAAAAEDAPAEDEATAEGIAVDPGVASVAAASRAAAAFAAGDAAAACAAWTEALIWAPGDAALLCRRAEGQLALGRAAESLADARNAAMLRPRLAEPQLRAGIALMAMEKPDEAAAVFRRALELEPSHEEAHIQLKAAERALAGRACLATLEGHTTNVSALVAAPCAMAADGGQPRFVLATAASDGELRLWDAAAGASAGSVATHTDGVVWMAWAPDASALVTAGADGTLRLWRITNGDACAALPQQMFELKGHEGRSTCGAFTPDGTRLVSCGLDGTARVWCIADGTCERVMLGHAKYIACLALSPDGALAATGSGDGTVRVWTLADGSVWDEVDCTDSGVVTHVTWLPRAGGARPLLVTANYNVKQDLSRVLVWDFQVKERTLPLQQYARVLPAKGVYGGRVHAMHALVGHDGPLAVYATGDGTITVFEPASKQPLFTLRRPHAPGTVRSGTPAAGGGSATATAAQLSPSGRLLATAGIDNAVKIWEADEGTLVCSLVGHTAPPRVLAWAADESMLASGIGDATPRVWAVPRRADE